MLGLILICRECNQQRIGELQVQRYSEHCLPMPSPVSHCHREIIRLPIFPYPYATMLIASAHWSSFSNNWAMCSRKSSWSPKNGVPSKGEPPYSGLLGSVKLPNSVRQECDDVVQVIKGAGLQGYDYYAPPKGRALCFQKRAPRRAAQRRAEFCGSQVLFASKR